MQRSRVVSFFTDVSTAVQRSESAPVADAGTLWLRLGDCEVDMSDPAVSLDQTPHGSARNVVVSRNGRGEASCLYWAPIRSSAEDDLLTYAVGLANNAEVLAETHRRMTARSGRRPQ